MRWRGKASCGVMWGCAAAACFAACLTHFTSYVRFLCKKPLSCYFSKLPYHRHLRHHPLLHLLPHLFLMAAKDLLRELFLALSIMSPLYSSVQVCCVALKLLNDSDSQSVICYPWTHLLTGLLSTAPFK